MSKYERRKVGSRRKCEIGSQIVYVGATDADDPLG